MFLMRLGAPGSEKPVARIDDQTYVELDDVVTDFDETFFGDNVTPDKIDNVLAVDTWLDLNGVRRQSGNTKTMVFDPFFIVHYLSQFLVLEPGDLISTGTPPDVGMSLTPPVWLVPGDVVELDIAGLGSQRQHVIGPR